MVTRSHYQL